MNKEKEIVIEAYKKYSKQVRELWKKLIKKFDFDEQTALTIVADFWYEPDNAEEFEDEWMESSDKIKDNIEKQFNVFIEHEEEMITVRNEYFVYDGNLVVEEERY